MHEYEIRILRADRSTDTVMEMIYLNDQSAIRSAKKLAEARPFEVWRDLKCIHGRPPKRRPPTSPPPLDAA